MLHVSLPLYSTFRGNNPLNKCLCIRQFLKIGIVLLNCVKEEQQADSKALLFSFTTTTEEYTAFKSHRLLSLFTESKYCISSFAKEAQGKKTLLNRTILTRHLSGIFQQCTYQMFLISAKKCKQINCLVSPSNKPINYILSKPDKQTQLFVIISLWKRQDSCFPLLYVLY